MEQKKRGLWKTLCELLGGAPEGYLVEHDQGEAWANDFMLELLRPYGQGQGTNARGNDARTDERTAYNGTDSELTAGCTCKDGQPCALAQQLNTKEGKARLEQRRYERGTLGDWG